MSDVYAVRSYGDPYFAGVQDDIAYMDQGNAPRSLSPDGEVVLTLDFTLERLPVMLSDADETHSLFSYNEYGGGLDRLWFGITPSGRLVAGWQGVGGSSFEFSSSPGLVVTDGRLHRAIFGTTNDGAGEMVLDGSLAAFAVADAGREWDEIGPSEGYLGRFILFNGLESTTKMAVTIRYAKIQFDAGGVEWNIEERFGTVLGGASSHYTQQNFDLTLQRFNPAIYPLAWGGISEASVQAAYRWYRKTLYTRQTRTKTQYQRVA